MYRKMPEYYEAWNVVRQIPGFYIEMSREEAGVLCGLIDEYRPRKILELGVAAGGSSCLIMKCLELLKLSETTVISMDLNELFYKEKSKETGYLLKENLEFFSSDIKHTFMLGKFAVDRLEEIGEGIDFLFLDTVHSIPGEIIDFLLLYPYLSSNAIVVLHDTNLHNEIFRAENAISNRVLVSAVTAPKFYTSEKKYLNIGAFQVVEDTAKYIEDVFASLLLPWRYMIDEETVNKYREAYKKSYPNEIVAIFDNAIEVVRFKEKIKEVQKELPRIFDSNKRVYIYGCGVYGKKLLAYLNRYSLKISGMIVSDEVELSGYVELIQQGQKIYHYSDIMAKSDESIILLATMDLEVKRLLDDSGCNYIDLVDFARAVG